MVGGLATLLIFCADCPEEFPALARIAEVEQP
jgi:hypothetical protein